MTFQVAVADTEFRFPCEPNESVLDAAQRAGLEIPFSCRKGVCGTCKGRIISGEARAFAGDALGAAERAEGHVLFCNARPRSDLVIAPRSISKADPFARKTIDARVFRLHKLAEDYDWRDRAAASAMLERHRADGNLVTGLIYMNEEPANLHQRLGTAQMPLNAMTEADLCPGSKALDAINVSLG